MMALGMEVGLGQGDIMLDGDTSPLPKKGSEPSIFAQFLLWPNGWMHQDATWYGCRPQPRGLFVLDGDPATLPKKEAGHSSPPQKRGHSPPIFGPSLLWPNGWMHQDAT